MKLIAFFIIALTTIAYTSYSQPTQTIVTTGIDTIRTISNNQIKQSVRAFVMVENLSLEIELLEARNKTLRNGLDTAKWLIDKRNEQVATLNDKVATIEKKQAKTNKILTYSLIGNAVLLVLVILIR